MRMRAKLLRTVAACALLLIFCAAAKSARASGGVPADTIALFPKETGELGYVDLKKARSEKWFPALREQILPGPLQAIRKVSGFCGSRSKQPGGRIGLGTGA